MNPELIEQLKQIGIELGVNSLPYRFPLHPNLVHFTLGLFIIGMMFDFAGTFFPIEKPIIKFLAMPARRNNFFDVGWYNTLAGTLITFLTVAAGFFEILLAQPPVKMKSVWGLGAGSTMLLHGVGGVILLGLMVAMTIWRGFQRNDALKHNHQQQVKWTYLLACVAILGIMFIHGTLGAQLGAEFGVHNTAAHLLRMGQNPNDIL